MLKSYQSIPQRIVVSFLTLSFLFTVFPFISKGQSYCTPTWEYNADGNMITQVIFGDINNTSPFTSGSTSSYEDFTVQSTTVEAGSTYSISVKGPSSTFPSDVMVFIDFNQNGSFDDAGESFYIGRLTSANPANALTITEDILIPSGAISGNTRMRVLKNTNISAYSDPNAVNSITSACGSYRSGQTEDYTLVINPSPSTSTYCTPTYSGWAINEPAEPITLVQFGVAENISGAINNSSVNEVSTATLRYENFSSISMDVVKGETYTLLVKANTNGNNTNYITVYFDWNGDGTFSNTTPEDAAAQQQLTNQPEKHQHTTAIINSDGADNKEMIHMVTIPTDAITGSVGMRIVKNLNAPSADPCSNPFFPRGQVEDYTLNITESESVYGVEISTENNASTTITTANGTLQLIASVLPATAFQDVTWSIESGSNTISIDQNGLVTAITNGNATVRATSDEDNTQFDEIGIEVNITPTGYCVPDETNAYALPIYEFNFNQTLTTSNNATDASPLYEDFTDTMFDVNKEQSYPVTIKGKTDGQANVLTKIYIDYNQDFIFSEDETIEIGFLSNTGNENGEISGNVLIPSTAQSGATRMRVVSMYHNPSSTMGTFVNTPCPTGWYLGQVEDYTVNISEGYCTATVEYDVEPITLVDFADLNNPTSAEINGSPAYEDFTSMTAHVEQGETYTITVKGNTNGNFTHDIRVLIDWNQDLEFDMSTEFYTVSLLPSTGEDAVEATINITVPENALTGNTRMRIIKDMWNVYEEGEFDGCTDAYYGQVEDYTINISESVVITDIAVSTQNNDPAEITTENGTLQLIATITPAEANQNVTWTIENGSEIVSVDANGLVTALANGNATVRATSVENGTLYDEIAITVNYPTITEVETIVVSVLNNADPEITTANGTLQLIATITPAEANQDVTWTVENGSEIVSIDANGLVTALANGIATARATSVEDNTKYDEIEITVNIQFAGLETPENQISIYPNPANEWIYVQNVPAGTTIEITDLSGKIIHTEATTSETISLNTQFLSGGTYILQLKNNNRIIANKKFTIIK